MAKQLARHDIDDTLYVFLQDNSKSGTPVFNFSGSGIANQLNKLIKKKL
jgi:late competence protein required for DNA uptake (superfamily II DNA/RNA helicase)|nr:hypothetical protein [Alteromonas macleodii]